jgi:selenocysteine lyase/cysteine desulfurase
MTVRDDVDWLVPRLAGWYAGPDPWTSLYGPPLRLAEDARRFSVSPAWFDVAATAEALEALLAVGLDRINDHDVGLANRCRRALDLPDASSAIVRVTTTSDPAEDLREAGIVATSRGGGTRLSFHLTNTGDDADRAAAVLRSHRPT